MHTPLRFVCLSFLLLLPLGCGHRDNLDRKVISGTITVGGEKAPRGSVRFVPIEGTSGPATAAFIFEGEYRVTNRAGVPLGKHRIEVIAQRPTGEKIEVTPGQFVEKMEDIGDKKYAGKNSPLTADVTADSSDTMDFEIPES